MNLKIISTLFILVLISLNFHIEQEEEEKNALKRVQFLFNHGIDKLEKNIDDLQDQAERYLSGSVEIESLKETLSLARSNYKRIEYLVEYYDPEAVKKMINGAPLPFTEKNVPVINIIQPKGMQVLDELVYAENPDPVEIEKHCSQLSKDYFKIKSYLSSIDIQHRHVYEACRQEVVRIFTMELRALILQVQVRACKNQWKP